MNTQQFMLIAVLMFVLDMAPVSTSSAAVIATTDGETPGVRIEVSELKRTSGGTVTLKFALVNDAPDDFKLLGQLGGLAYGYNVSGVHLVDPAGKKKYTVVLGADGKCLCSSELVGTVDSKARINLWAKYPEPPKEVQKVTVIVPHFIPMDDVPVSR